MKTYYYITKYADTLFENLDNQTNPLIIKAA
jgi:hypothetical protein